MEHFSLASTPGAFMVDIFPILKYVPWAPFKRRGREWYNKLSELINVPMDFVHSQMKKGLAEPCFVAKWLEEPGRESDKAMIPLRSFSLKAHHTLTAATVSAISTFFIAILHYPEVKKLAQKEIDEVLGKDRLPTFADRASLPYVEALYKEVMRWQPIAPIGVPHRLGSEIDDEYNGGLNIHRFPAQVLIHATRNACSRQRDGHFQYMVHACPGVAVAQTSVWLSIALTLAAFNVTPLTGEDGKPIVPSLEYSNTTVTHPKPFHCNIFPRSDRIKETIEEISL
ncbi:O-methylsterigmatocystin oxidoreductase [Rhizoctonia solani 123E]|uniref:O-methylsterigmatocystin oxidoreductase n=1 Tax=Rhizoctonia solani 123E TaxID=1423351 RepID=A0A074RT04_9AGAM|nr:O-methylsterigmatocystin oxidoreductase [Rhizoctonia solani 123E]